MQENITWSGYESVDRHIGFQDGHHLLVANAVTLIVDLLEPLS